MLTARHRKRADRRRRLYAEPLEDRRLMATITVTSLSDGTLLQLAGDGEISLREAIQAAEHDFSVDGSVAGSAGKDTIVFEAGLSGTIVLQDGAFRIQNDLEIIGNGRTETVIDAHLESRILNASSDITLRNLRLWRGRSTDNQARGGAILADNDASRLSIYSCDIWNNATLGSHAEGGAIFSYGDVFIYSSDVANNATHADVSPGGAVFGDQNVYIQSSTVSGNVTHGEFSDGGAIAAGYNVTVLYTTMSNNATLDAADGGAIRSRSAYLRFANLVDNSAAGHGGAIRATDLFARGGQIADNTAANNGGGVYSFSARAIGGTVSGNSAGAFGGGLAAQKFVADDSTFQGNRAERGGGIVVVDNGSLTTSTVSGNTAVEAGGGISMGGFFGSLTVTNSTVSGNRVQGSGAGGGGIDTHAGRVTVAHSTIAGNTVVGSNSRGGGIRATHIDAEAHLFNSIVAGNGASTGMAPEIAGMSVPNFTSQHSVIGNNKDSPLAEANPTRDANGNLVGGPISGVVNPLLGALEYRGGPTKTRPLSAVSPAIDFFDPSGAFFTVNDQRGPGYLRNRDGDNNGTALIDAGAFELRLRFSAIVGLQAKFSAGSNQYNTEDLVAYTESSDTWRMYFDGSDVGLAGAAIDAYHQEEDGSILMSFRNATSVPGFGEVRGADLVRFVPTSLGDDTQGTFQMVYTGDQLGLDGSVDNIDALGRANDGRLVVSTENNVLAANGWAQGHDLLVIEDGALLPYFDGEQVGLDRPDENITGVWFEPGTGVIFMTTRGAFEAGGVSGNQGDIFAFAPTELESETVGKFYPFQQMPRLDLDIPIAGMNILYSDQVSSTIGNLVFEDINHNGVQDITESGIADVTIALLDAGGNVLGETRTDASGQYQFSELVPGVYQLRITRPAEYRLTQANVGGNDLLDSDFDRLSGLSPQVSMGTDEVNVSLDAGMYRRRTISSVDVAPTAGPSEPLGRPQTWAERTQLAIRTIDQCFESL